VAVAYFRISIFQLSKKDFTSLNRLFCDELVNITNNLYQLIVSNLTHYSFGKIFSDIVLRIFFNLFFLLHLAILLTGLYMTYSSGKKMG
jgi:hypothetical protein